MAGRFIPKAVSVMFSTRKGEHPYLTRPNIRLDLLLANRPVLGLRHKLLDPPLLEPRLPKPVPIIRYTAHDDVLPSMQRHTEL